MNAKKIVANGMLVLGIGMVVFTFSHYTPAGAGEIGGWDHSCQWMMAIGAMIAMVGKLTSQ